jgi:hypothetical protein
LSRQLVQFEQKTKQDEHLDSLEKKKKNKQKKEMIV